MLIQLQMNSFQLKLGTKLWWEMDPQASKCPFDGYCLNNGNCIYYNNNRLTVCCKLLAISYVSIFTLYRITFVSYRISIRMTLCKQNFSPQKLINKFYVKQLKKHYDIPF